MLVETAGINFSIRLSYLCFEEHKDECKNFSTITTSFVTMLFVEHHPMTFSELKNAARSHGDVYAKSVAPANKMLVKNR